MKEYKIGKGWAIFIYIFAPLLIALFSGLLIMPSFWEDTPVEIIYFLAPLSLGMIVVFVIALLDTINGKVIISSNTLSTRSTFINRDLEFQEIKGFIVGKNNILVIPNTDTKKKIKISNHIGNANEFILWLSSNFPDLQQVKVVTEKTEILDNLDFGGNAEERSYKLNQAKKVTKGLNWLSGIICIWVLFKPEPYEYAILSSISLPLITILAIYFYKGLIKIDEKQASAYPTVFFAILMAPTGLFLRALFDYNIFDYSNVWIPSIIIGSTMVTLLIFGSKEFKFKKAKDYFTVLSLFIFFFGFGYSSTVTLNCIYDESIPQSYYSKVVDKRISSGKTTTYYLELAPWGSKKENDDVSVSKELYEKLEIDESVLLYLKEGKFDIPWFVVTQ